MVMPSAPSSLPVGARVKSSSKYHDLLDSGVKGRTCTFDKTIIFSTRLTISLNLLSFAVFEAIRWDASVLLHCPIAGRKPISLSFIIFSNSGSNRIQMPVRRRETGGQILNIHTRFRL
jgi:hypothetical protein